MTPLIAMPGPWLPDAAPGREDAEALPPLPSLSALLRRARRLPDAADWRDGVIQALEGGAALPAAAIAARAIDLPEQAPLCFATPLHVIAGISRVHLPPGGRVLLTPAEEDSLLSGFNATFAGEARLHAAAAGGGWLLDAPFAAAARDAAPDDLVGVALQRLPAQGDAERALRRLAAESEMWLSAHPVNRERERRGEPPLNALWFWEGGHARALPALRAPALIAARGVPDAWLAGLAAQVARPVRSGVDFESAMGGKTGHGYEAATALLIPAPDNGGPSRHYWQMLDEQWIGPAMQALRAGHLRGLRLQLGRTAWQLPPRRLAWLWPERRRWWQLAGQVQP